MKKYLVMMCFALISAGCTAIPEGDSVSAGSGAVLEVECHRQKSSEAKPPLFVLTPTNTVVRQLIAYDGKSVGTLTLSLTGGNLAADFEAYNPQRLKGFWILITRDIRSSHEKHHEKFPHWRCHLKEPLKDRYLIPLKSLDLKSGDLFSCAAAAHLKKYGHQAKSAWAEGVAYSKKHRHARYFNVLLDLNGLQTSSAASSGSSVSSAQSGTSSAVSSLLSSSEESSVSSEAESSEDQEYSSQQIIE